VVLDDLIAFATMYDVSVIRASVKNWLQISISNTPHPPKRIKLEPRGVGPLSFGPSWFLLQRRSNIADLFQLDTPTLRVFLKNATDVCNAHLQLLAFYRPFLQQPFEQLAQFTETLLDDVDPKSFLRCNVDPFAWFRFDLICRWIDFDAKERATHFNALVERMNFNRMTIVQLTCALQHPLVLANPPVSQQIANALVSRSAS
jgi:hypothetical protein